MTLPAPHLVPLGLGLAAAAVFDLVRRRVPNWICAVVLVSGLVVRGVDQGPLSALAALGAAALIFGLLFVPWKAGGLGGGDVKLAAATAAWFGFASLPWFALATAVAGGVLALVCYVAQRPTARAEVRANLTLALLQNGLPSIVPRREGHVRVPYALAIAVGATVALLLL
jgi:prepilin peptidase CpaA